MSTLKELREQWEKGSTVICEIPDDEFCFLVVIGRNIESEDGACGTTHTGRCFTTKFSLYRYFKIGDHWTISADVSEKGPRSVFDRLKIHKFMTKIPNE